MNCLLPPEFNDPLCSTNLISTHAQSINHFARTHGTILPVNAHRSVVEILQFMAVMW